jgi:hypothetical protein
MLINTALIAEYLALAHSLPDDNTTPAEVADYRRANQLAYQLAMDLPADLWRTILRAFMPPSVTGIDQGQAVEGSPAWL